MRLAIVAALLALGFSSAAGAAPLEAYGQLQTLDQVTLSPDGSKIAYIIGGSKTDSQFIVVQPAGGGGPLAALDVGDAKIRDILWVDETRLIIINSQTRGALDILGPRREYFLATLYDLASRRQSNLLDGFQGGWSMNTIYRSPVVRMVDGQAVVFAFGVYFPENRGRLALFKVDFAPRSVKMIDAHSGDTEGWFIDKDGNVVADEEFDDKNAHWSLRFRKDSWKEVYGENIAADTPDVEGFNADGSALVVRYKTDGKRTIRAFSVADASPLEADKAASGDGTPIHDRLTGRVVAYAYADRDVSYEFVDQKDETAWKRVLAMFPGEQVDLVSASDDRRKIVVEVTGVNSGVEYFLIDTATSTHVSLGPAYKGIEADDVSGVRNVTYQSSDGRPIDAYLTLPHGRAPEKLPLIVFPHGGPAARDLPGFDWWAQALASQGYAVLQPQFRGSDGFGWGLLSAGFGQWGRKMQTDLSDGVRALAKLGMIDPARVCIVGGSYGGYAALAGATIDTGVYRCAVSYGGVSDLRGLIEWDERDNGDRRLGDRYWLRFMGAASKDDPVLDQLSPLHLAGKSSIPVLLIHGKDDTVVPIAQSEDMADALEKAGKPVTFIKLDGEDHWLSRSATRLQMLKATVDFLKVNNPP